MAINMTPDDPARWLTTCLTLVCMTFLVGFTCRLTAEVVPVQQAGAAAQQGSASQGEELFAGKVRFRNGGPACASCHSVAGIPFPNGGTLGPNLTHAYAKLGPQGMQPAMQTLFFNVMTPIYDQHPLTAQEQSDLIAFFKQAESRQAPRWNTQIIVAMGITVFLVLLLIAGLIWQDRLKSVRRILVAKAAGLEGHS